MKNKEECVALADVLTALGRGEYVLERQKCAVTGSAWVLIRWGNEIDTRNYHYRIPPRLFSTGQVGAVGEKVIYLLTPARTGAYPMNYDQSKKLALTAQRCRKRRKGRTFPRTYPYRVIIHGNGNVAIGCQRVVWKDLDALARTERWWT